MWLKFQICVIFSGILFIYCVFCYIRTLNSRIMLQKSRNIVITLASPRNLLCYRKLSRWINSVIHYRDSANYRFHSRWLPLYFTQSLIIVRERVQNEEDSTSNLESIFHDSSEYSTCLMFDSFSQRSELSSTRYHLQVFARFFLHCLLHYCAREQWREEIEYLKWGSTSEGDCALVLANEEYVSSFRSSISHRWEQRESTSHGESAFFFCQPLAHLLTPTQHVSIIFSRLFVDVEIVIA